MGVVPCAASEQPAGQGPKLTRLSPASQRILNADRGKASAQDQGAPESGNFLHSRRGVIALTLMGAGAGFAIWSAHHDRQPVKSPIR